MRFVAVKSEENQAAAVIFRTRDLLVRQRTQLINALRGHMGEFGLVVPQGADRAKELVALVADPDTLVPAAARPALQVLVSALERLEAEICGLEAEIVRRARENEVARRLMTIPGVGPLIATALVALAPPPQTFRRGRDFAAAPRTSVTGHWLSSADARAASARATFVWRGGQAVTAPFGGRAARRSVQGPLPWPDGPSWCGRPRGRASVRGRPRRPPT